ncbi:HyaD/HybD family hydrogenase maturation endopeptidase [Alteromonas confluentis]|uniref:Hydrogenase expression/formation protein n=1 Tax=Alteromonas confluentis TaxID=1656094 RepID=A0A1E7ZDG7_9ALTE|nr:HyaD/HybD family hydrogenase maturation endopeptidase [Alteromonas confluentis]OFC71556.1 hydrogenase expression/formation protein [Alteromonas confluentis]
MNSKKVLILGIGNVLWADEGFGVRCIEALNQDYVFEGDVKLMDGGTQGIYLVQHVQEADVLVVFDAIDYGLAPGTLKVVYNDDVPKFMGAKKMSLHQTGFQEVLAMAEFTGNYPSALLLVGCQPEELEDFGGSLRDVVKAQIEPAIDTALNYLTDFGITAQKQQTNNHALSPEQLNLSDYEQGRPDEASACRTGDIRFFPPAQGEQEAH